MAGKAKRPQLLTHNNQAQNERERCVSLFRERGGKEAWFGANTVRSYFGAVSRSITEGPLASSLALQPSRLYKLAKNFRKSQT